MEVVLSTEHLTPYRKVPAVAKSDEHSIPDRRARVRDSPGATLPSTLMAPGAYKIRHRCNVLQVPIQIIPLGVPKQGSHPLRGESKMWLHVSGSSSRMNPKPSAIALCVALVCLFSIEAHVVKGGFVFSRHANYALCRLESSYQWVLYSRFIYFYRPCMAIFPAIGCLSVIL